VLEKISNFEQAIEAYQQAIALNPHTDAHNNLGNIWLQIGQIPEAEKVYRQAIQENPKDFGSYQNLGNILMVNSNWDEAIEIYILFYLFSLHKSLDRAIARDKPCNLLAHYSASPI
jgi:tetratricopeptide (TPR) repeat protein